MPDLDFVRALTRPDLLATSVLTALTEWSLSDQVTVGEIDPDLADTAAFCQRYAVSLEESVNCVVVAGRRGDQTTLAACLVRATTRTDVNGLVRRLLDVRKASFAPMDVACTESGMEYGGITPIGLPRAWPLLVDAAACRLPSVVIGSGVRRSKLRLPGAALAELPRAQVLDGLGVDLG